MNGPNSFTQYCDDVRREADGRPSLMGIYPNRAVIELDGHKRLPKICAYTVITLPLDRQLGSISVVSFWNDKKLQGVDIPDEVITEFNKESNNKNSKKQQLSLATVIEIRDLDINDGGILLTKVTVNNVQIESQALRLTPRQTVAVTHADD